MMTVPIDWPLTLREVLDCFLLDCPFDADIVVFGDSADARLILESGCVSEYMSFGFPFLRDSAPVLDFKYFPGSRSLYVVVPLDDLTYRRFICVN